MLIFDRAPRIIVYICVISEHKLINDESCFLQKGDRLLVISEDEDSYRPGISNAPLHTHHLPNMEKHSKQVLKVLICGWTNHLKDVLHLIDSNVARGNSGSPSIK